MLLLRASPVFALPRTAGEAPGAGPDRTREYLVQELRGGRSAVFEERVASNRGKRLFGAWVPDNRVELGLGVYRVPKSSRYDPNRSNPMRDPTGKTMGVAAVGMSLRF